MMLIKVLSAVLLASLFGMFVYFSTLQQKLPETSSYAAFCLMLFVIASLILALALIWVENLPEDGQKNSSEVSDSSEKLKPVLEEISRSHKHMNKVFNMALENFNNRLDGLENATSQQHLIFTEKMQKLQQKFPDIFKDTHKEDLAKTLSSLEILKDSLTDEPNYRDVDIKEIIGTDKNQEK